MFDSIRDDLSIITIPDRPVQTAGRIMLRLLRSNGAILTPLDIYPGTDGGPVVDFLGRKTLMFSGSARIAAKTGAPIVCARVFREKDGYHYRVRYWPAKFVPPEAADGKSEEAREAVADMSEWLSDVIREAPEQWLWMHKRWRPEDLK
jgi:lauroyl/myristoyl acyltransferase